MFNRVAVGAGQVMPTSQNCAVSVLLPTLVPFIRNSNINPVLASHVSQGSMPGLLLGTDAPVTMLGGVECF